MPLSRVQQRRLASRNEAKALLQQLLSEQSDVYLSFRQLYGLWCGNNAAVQELRPLFRMSGMDPDGQLSVTPEFETKVKSFAADILPKFDNPVTG